MESRTVELFGRPTSVLWASDDNRIFANLEQCYELVSFPGRVGGDEDQLRRGLPVRLEWYWLPNPDYEQDTLRELGEWHATGYQGRELPVQAVTLKGWCAGPSFVVLRREHYVPPEAKGLPLLVPDGNKPVIRAVRIGCIVREVFRNGREEPTEFPASRFLPGIKVAKATFLDGEVLYFRNVEPRHRPSEAEAFFRLNSVILESDTNRTALQATKKELEVAQEAAARTLEEALRIWMRFDPPGMSTTTQAKIEKAVKLYCANPSLRAVAEEFKVSRTAVSKWLRAFTRETRYDVVRHQQHESVKSHLQAENGNLPARRRTKEVLT